jgi:hypothetical protein
MTIINNRPGREKKVSKGTLSPGDPEVGRGGEEKARKDPLTKYTNFFSATK